MLIHTFFSVFYSKYCRAAGFFPLYPIHVHYQLENADECDNNAIKVATQLLFIVPYCNYAIKGSVIATQFFVLNANNVVERGYHTQQCHQFLIKSCFNFRLCAKCRQFPLYQSGASLWCLQRPKSFTTRAMRVFFNDFIRYLHRDFIG